MNAFEILGSTGPFAAKIKSFKPRSQQQEMAVKIEQIISCNSTLVAESGTGTGKTYAYLVPAITSGRKVVVSTGTKYLQDQLYLRDIPTVSQTMNASVNVAILKGRSNYLCLERLENLLARSPQLARKVNADVREVRAWKNRTKNGDIAEIESVNEDSIVWPEVTSNSDNCIGSDCGFYEQCFVNKARKRAQQADVIVVNHHLYFADHALKQDGFGKLLPEADVWIFDEAHQLPDIASNFLGQSLSLRQIIELTKDTRVAEAIEKSGIRELAKSVDLVEKAARDTQMALLNVQGRYEWNQFIADKNVFTKRLKILSNKLLELLDYLSAASVSGEALGRCYERVVSISALVERFSGLTSIDQVRWIEVNAKSFRIHETPLNIGSAVQSAMVSRPCAKIFTSATLSIDGRFDHYLEQMGLVEVDVEKWDSPFNFQRQAMLYLPMNLPAPNHPDYAVKLVDAILPVVQASQGRAFLLFTSYRLMHKVREYFSGQGFRLLVQGQANKQSLISEFKSTPRAILFATMSFWEGVDIQGDTLSCVVIDKLPFESPNDPVLQARMRAIEETGKNPFMNYSLPRAVISLRQGAGRLIRGGDDTGLLMLCDPRISSARYGRLFVDSLPPMKQTVHEAEAIHFLQSFADPQNAATFDSSTC